MYMKKDGFVKLALVMTMFCVMIAMIVGTNVNFAQDAKPQNEASEKYQYQRLEGKWMRPDGGYILRLSNVGVNGELKAGFYNPKSINVGISNWRKDDSKLTVIVELRDINYQGSTYTLTYDSDSDRLKGKYFQAPTGMTYEVEFLRAK
jgi:uncharacterized protein (DUF2147 family)